MVEMFCVIPRSWHSSFMNFDVNLGSWSLITLCKKESQLQSKKMDFSQEKSRKSQFF